MIAQLATAGGTVQLPLASRLRTWQCEEAHGHLSPGSLRGLVFTFVLLLGLFAVHAIEGINGVLLLGWSTAFFVSLVARLGRR